jgi:hypothetical protein
VTGRVEQGVDERGDHRNHHDLGDTFGPLDRLRLELAFQHQMPRIVCRKRGANLFAVVCGLRIFLPGWNGRRAQIGCSVSLNTPGLTQPFLRGEYIGRKFAW